MRLQYYTCSSTLSSDNHVECMDFKMLLSSDKGPLLVDNQGASVS